MKKNFTRNTRQHAERTKKQRNLPVGMSGLFGGSQQSPEQIEAVRKKRQEYQDYLTNQQTNVTTSVNKKELTPESGNAALKTIKTAQDWLAKNPNATLDAVLANREATNTEIQRILQTDPLKKNVFIIYTVLPTAAKEAEQKKIIKPEITIKIDALAAELKKWYTKNKDTATSIDFNQQIAESEKKLKEIVVDQTAIDYIQGKLNEMMKKSPDEVEKLRQQEEKSIEQQQDQTIDIGKGIQTALGTATKTFWGFLLITFCIMAGSFAANMAIGRPPAYRVFYFLWGAFPFFAPLVVIYTIFRRIKEGRLPMYAVLPVSIEPATTRLGRFLWYPFYYVPDNDAVEMYKKFQDSLAKVASL